MSHSGADALEYFWRLARIADGRAYQHWAKDVGLLPTRNSGGLCRHRRVELSRRKSLAGKAHAGWPVAIPDIFKPSSDARCVR